MLGPQPGRFGSSVLSQSANTPMTVPGVQVDVSQMRGTTRFNDLHEELQKQIEQGDAFIQQQTAFASQCAALMPAHSQSLDQLSPDVEFVAHKADAVELGLDNDSLAVGQLKETVKRDVDEARLAWRVVDNLKLPQQFHHSGLVWPGTGAPTRSLGGAAATDVLDEAAAATDLVSYFSTRADALAATFADYQQNITEIEAHLRLVESTAVVQTNALLSRRGPLSANDASAGRDDDLRSLSAVLADFERGILAVASKIGATREAVVEASLQ